MNTQTISNPSFVNMSHGISFPTITTKQPIPKKVKQVSYNNTDNTSFDINQGLLGLFKKLYLQQQSAIIDLDEKHRGLFYLKTKDNILYIRTHKNNIKIICKQSISVSSRELEEYSFDAKQLTNIRAKVHLDRFIWIISLLTAKGRLPKHIDPNKTQLRLKHWPNLSRYKIIPSAIQLAAFFSQTPTSVAMAIKMLGCKAEDIHNFISACDAINILETTHKDKTITSLNKELPSKNRGLLTGLLHRLFK